MFNLRRCFCITLIGTFVIIINFFYDIYMRIIRKPLIRTFGEGTRTGAGDDGNDSHR